MLAERLELPTEYKILTKDVLGITEKMPRFYKVDLASPENQIAIEVDGRSHKFKSRQYLDYKKEIILDALGWRILRVTNKQVLENFDYVLEWIQARLKEGRKQ